MDSTSLEATASAHPSSSNTGKNTTVTSMSDFLCSFSYGSNGLFELQVPNWERSTHAHTHWDENFPSTTHTEDNMQTDIFMSILMNDVFYRVKARHLSVKEKLPDTFQYKERMLAQKNECHIEWTE